MKCIRCLLAGIGAITLVLIMAALVTLDFSEDRPRHLAAYSNAEWRGGPDSGEYYEITQASPPYFHVQIRFEDGELWREDWFKLNVGTKEQALKSIAGYGSAEEIYLSIST